MNIAQLKDRKFLCKEDCGNGILVTIDRLTQESVNREGAPEELKYALWFKEADKPLIINSINAQIISTITGSDDTDHWPGHKIVLFSDPNVSFGGKLVGGIRVRAPRNQPAPTPKVAPKPATARQQPKPEAVQNQEGEIGGDDCPF